MLFHIREGHSESFFIVEQPAVAGKDPCLMYE